MMREADERRRRDIFRKEIAYFEKHKAKRIEERDKKLEKYLAEKEDFADAAFVIEEIEQRKLEAKERKRRQREEEKERIRLEELQRQEELRLQKEAEERAERERIEREQKEAQERQIAADMQILAVYYNELAYFFGGLPAHRRQRADYAESLRRDEEMRESQRRLRAAQKMR